MRCRYIKDYVYEAYSVGQKGGRLWVMPAGAGGEQYTKQLHCLDWHKLYDELDGFLLLEDINSTMAI